MMFLGPLVLLVHLLRPVVAGDSTVVVKISTGQIQGKISTTVNSSLEYAAFKGIPYAEAPVKRLRFQPPVPYKAWNGIKPATEEGSECPQIRNRTVIGSEDCLFLNVFTPVTKLSAIKKPLKPVMVWIHDGTFSDGSGSTDDRRPDFLLERDVVFVSMNYRLGALGFLSLDHPDATGNQGLKDQNLALKWVQANIKKFGGDPKNVTIFGKGAGAASVGFHVLSEASIGLFHRAISMSGSTLSPLSFLSRAEAVKRGKKLAQLVKTWLRSSSTTKSHLKNLRVAPVGELLAKSHSIDLVAPFVPTLENSTRSANVFLTKCAIDKYWNGEINEVPQLLGFAERETTQYSQHTVGFVRLIEKTQKLISSMDGNDEISPNLVVLKNVIKRMKDKILDDTVELKRQTKAAADIVTGVLLKLPMHEMKRLLVEAKENSSVYYYKMTSDAEDLAYIFYTPSKHYDLSSKSSTGIAINRMSTMWTNFAKYGNPTPDGVDKRLGNITWPKAKSFGPILEIGDEVRSVSKPFSYLDEVMLQFYRKVLYHLSDCS